MSVFKVLLALLVPDPPRVWDGDGMFLSPQLLTLLGAQNCSSSAELSLQQGQAQGQLGFPLGKGTRGRRVMNFSKINILKIYCTSFQFLIKPGADQLHPLD